MLGVGKTMDVGGGGPYRVRQSMSSHVEHRSYDFADPSMSCLSSPTLAVDIVEPLGFVSGECNSKIDIVIMYNLLSGLLFV